MWLSDVTEAHGPTHVVSRALTAHLPAWPNWLPVSEAPELYAAEVSAAGPAGTVLAYTRSTFHRGTEMTAPRGARYSLHVNFRPAGVEWANRHGWAKRASPFTAGWNDFVARASARQLALFGFPPQGHAFWTDETLRAVTERYPTLALIGCRAGRLVVPSGTRGG